MPTNRHVVLEHSQPRVEGNTLIGVKICGAHSKNGYSYPQHVLRAAMPLYESAPVFVRHANKREEMGGIRQLCAHFGSLTNVRERGNSGDVGLFADLPVRPTHPAAELVLEGNGSEPYGLSHHAIVTMTDDGKAVAEIVAVHSVDLVTEPATTQTLFEEQDMPETNENNDAAAGNDATQGGSFEEKMLVFMAKILMYVEPKDADLVKAAEAAGQVSESVQRQEGVQRKQQAAQAARITALESVTDANGELLGPSRRSNADKMKTLRGEA